ncbi:MAG: sugar transferase, partial [Deltaproteobacteria bacterium]|nr:sugar transferase [Deltaproteobacteria bacterium]
DKAFPEDPYGISKWEAEQELHKISSSTGIEVVILRPPLVYGPGVKANFLKLFNIVNRGTPLPFSCIDNQRSLIYLGNLIDSIITCINHPEAAGQTYLICDQEYISTPELIRKIASAIGKPTRLFYIPLFLIRLVGKLIGRSAAIDRLLGSLMIDNTKIRKELGWKPPYTMEHGLKETAKWFTKGLEAINGQNLRMKRIFDIILVVLLIGISVLPMLVISILVKMSSKGPILYWSDRIGKNNKIFKMPKFRTMKIDTPAVATHLMKNPEVYCTPIGSFLRKLSLDELPQVYSVLTGDMSFVGPRPALFNQDDLIQLRKEKGIHRLIPGITGWAQINGRDDLPIPEKVDLDEYYLNNRSFIFDLKTLIMTFLSVINSQGIQH